MSSLGRTLVWPLFCKRSSLILVKVVCERPATRETGVIRELIERVSLTILLELFDPNSLVSISVR